MTASIWLIKNKRACRLGRLGVWTTFVSTLIYSFVSSVHLSRKKIFWSDEVLEFLADNKASVTKVIIDQRDQPWMLDPPVWHILEHFLIKSGSKQPELLMRLPSIVALLAAEVVVFNLTHKLTQNRVTALTAMALLMAFPTSVYSVEARPYMLLVCLFVTALLSYTNILVSQVDNPENVPRTQLLILFLCLSSVVLLHFLGFMLLLPFLIAELSRGMKLNNAGWKTRSIILASSAVVLLNVPFLKSAHLVQTHYYHDASTHPKMIITTYLWMLMHSSVYQIYPGRRELAEYCFTALSVPVLLAKGYSVLKSDNEDRNLLPADIAVLTAALLPVAYLAVAQFSHAFSLRYALPGVGGLAILTAACFQDRASRPRFSGFFYALVVSFSVWKNRTDANDAGAYSVQVLTRLRDFAQVDHAFLAQTDRHLYTQALAQFVVAEFYSPPAVRATLVAVRDTNKELFWRERWASSIFAKNLESTTTLPIMTYQDFLRLPGSRLILVYHDQAEEWMDEEIDTGALPATLVGRALGGSVYQHEKRECDKR